MKLVDIPHVPPRFSGLAALLITGLMALPATAQRQTLPLTSPVPPDQLFAPVGTVLTVQVRDHLASNKNTRGDAFIGMLQKPLVIDGWVVARPGQTVFGTVTSATNAGRVRGTSELGLELTEIMLVDGYQIPVRTQLLKDYGPESHREDATAIAGISAIGAIIGVAAGGGKGAAIGAGLGAAAATAGVLSTRGKATEIYPETSLTFRLDAPLIVQTVQSRQAFLAVSPDDYKNPTPVLRVPARREPETTVVYRSYPPPSVIYVPEPRYHAHPRTRVEVIVLPPVIIRSHHRDNHGDNHDRDRHDHGRRDDRGRDDRGRDNRDRRR